MDDLMSILAQLDPKLLEAMSVSLEDHAAPYKQQLGLGEGLMATPSAAGRTVGNTYVASSPLEHLSVAIRQGMGGRMANQAIAGQQGLAGQAQQGRGGLMQAIAEALRKRQMEQQQMTQGAGQMMQPSAGGEGGGYP